MKRYVLLLTLSVCVAAANAAAPKRPMLEKGKTWTYIYHHFTDRESPGPNGKLYDEETWFVWYTLEGDTVIDGRQYMTIYKYDQRGTDRKYSDACREDDEGRVYAYNNNEEKMSFDFGIHFSDGHFSNATRVPETIKVNGQLFCRYRYYDALSGGNIVDLGYSCVEGVGFKDAGLMMNPFAPRPTCICDYMKFYSVSGKDFNFYNSDFDAPKEIELEEGEQELICRALADCGALDGLGHSQHILTQSESVLRGLDDWRLSTGSEARTLPVGAGKGKTEENPVRDSYRKVISEFLAAYSGE